jgi:hypothetical protein
MEVLALNYLDCTCQPSHLYSHEQGAEHFQFNPIFFNQEEKKIVILVANMFAGCSTAMPRKAHTQNMSQIQRQRNINPIFGKDDLILIFDGFDTVPSATKIQIVRNKGRPSAFLTNLGDSNTVYFAITHSRLI